MAKRAAKRGTMGRRVAKVDGAWRAYVEALRAGDPKAAELRARWERMT